MSVRQFIQHYGEEKVRGWPLAVTGMKYWRFCVEQLQVEPLPHEEFLEEIKKLEMENAA